MTLHQYPDLIQGTDAWHDIRRGIVTASTVKSLLAEEKPDAIEVPCGDCGTEAGMPCLGKRKPHAPISTIHDARKAAVAHLPSRLVIADNDTSRALTTTLTAERLSGFTEDTPLTMDMRRGVDSEPLARDHYNEHHAPVVETGFMVRDDWGFSLGYSPDGLVGDDGLIEIKSPRAKTHVATILANEVPAHYMAQLQAGLLVSGRKWIDFVSYCGGMPLWVIRVQPDPAWHKAIVAAVAAFEQASGEMAATYHQRTKGLPRTERVEFDVFI